mgnify:CR=1 FL=1
MDCGKHTQSLDFRAFPLCLFLWKFFSLLTHSLSTISFNIPLPTFQHQFYENSRSCRDQTELIFEVMSLTVPAIDGSFFRSCSTFLMELRTVAWFLSS